MEVGLIKASMKVKVMVDRSEAFNKGNGNLKYSMLTDFDVDESEDHGFPHSGASFGKS